MRHGGAVLRMLNATLRKGYETFLPQLCIIDQRHGVYGESEAADATGESETNSVRQTRPFRQSAEILARLEETGVLFLPVGLCSQLLSACSVAAPSHALTAGNYCAAALGQ